MGEDADLSPVFVDTFSDQAVACADDHAGRIADIKRMSGRTRDGINAQASELIADHAHGIDPLGHDRHAHARPCDCDLGDECGSGFFIQSVSNQSAIMSSDHLKDGGMNRFPDGVGLKGGAGPELRCSPIRLPLRQLHRVQGGPLQSDAKTGLATSSDHCTRESCRQLNSVCRSVVREHPIAPGHGRECPRFRPRTFSPHCDELLEDFGREPRAADAVADAQKDDLRLAGRFG